MAFGCLFGPGGIACAGDAGGLAVIAYNDTLAPRAMRKCSTEIIDKPHGKMVRISGVIDDDFDLELAGEQEVVVFDLSGVTRITSFGVKEWRERLGPIEAQYLGFVCCRPALLSQFNLIPGFACGGELISFYLPYMCPECDHFAETLLDLRGETSIFESVAPPEMKCGECGAAMEFEDFPDYYFKYVRATARPRPPRAASAVIDGNSSG